MTLSPQQILVQGLRDAVPYIREHDGKVFVLAFGGEALDHPESFQRVVRDLVLIADLGIRLVIVPGARPQINRRLAQAGLAPRFHEGLRITDFEMIDPVSEAVGALQFDLLSWLSTRLSMSSGSGLAQRVLTGNFLTARPMGVIDGVDLGFTGAVRRIDVEGIRDALGDGSIVVQSNLGFSPTGELFNLRAEDVAEAIAVSLGADKLIFLTDPVDDLPSVMSLVDVRMLLDRTEGDLSDEFRLHLESAMHACTRGVDRVHLIDRDVDGALLVELFTRDGSGTLISAEPFEKIRPATLDDIGGIVALIEPLELAGVLVRRSREQLELEIGRFVVIERDGDVIGCAALYPYPESSTAELAALVVHPAYQRGGRAGRLLTFLESRARSLGLRSVFLLSTQTMAFFKEKGFVDENLSELPSERQALYNFKRNSRIYRKWL
ncbi:amino-acid N-acetyltransferase [Halothiobacillus diazotrophicus]|uniref:Amino-acid acetyltransferase n=1 Tax=Halothiobacillus diazotrophicus TaxID=1860122 RepID=A0A191ZK70_9GAMM|nr:amino-acid N-acetyltransferase [Halothiobacillus diazotrophicus]ANJ68284.1 amino-acid N-acetyltransferase [Halothiobacillus diazotrophicus]